MRPLSTYYKMNEEYDIFQSWKFSAPLFLFIIIKGIYKLPVTENQNLKLETRNYL